MKFWKSLCWLLCMAVFLAACGQDPLPTTAATAPETTLPTTQPLSDPATRYLDAVDALEKQDAYSLVIKHTKDVDVAGEVISQSQEQAISYADGIYSVGNTVDFGAYRITAQELWCQDTVYLDLEGDKFSSPMEQEAFLTRYVPLALLTPENYSSVTEAEGVISFADAAVPEDWLALEEMTLVTAQGSATLSKDALTASTYELTYSYGGITITEAWDISYMTVAHVPGAPKDTAAYVSVESIDGPMMVEQAMGMLLKANHLQSNVYQYILTQAGGSYLNRQYTVAAMDEMYRVQTDATQFLNGDTVRFQQDELFRDGKYTVSMDDGEPETVPGVSLESMTDYTQQITEAGLCATSYIAQSTCTDLGSLILAEFTGNAQWADDARASVCYTLFQNEALLDDLASSQTDDTLEFYVALDKYTGLPTASGYNYSGTHTIEGQSYLLSDQVDISYDIGSLNAYETISEEPAPDREVASPTPLFYRVTGDKGQQMWLFGTIHVGDDRTGNLPQEIYDALAAADALAVECDTESFDEQVEEDEELLAAVQDAYFYSDGSTTLDHIADEALRKQAVQAMKATGSYFYNSPYLKVSLWSNSLTNYSLQQIHSLTSEKGLEARLMALAEDLEKPLLEVESSLFQIQMMGNWSEALQEELLSDAVADLGIGSGLATVELYELWCSGDEAALIEMLNEEDTSELTEEELALYEEYIKTMSSDRNTGMLEVAKKYLESGDTVFYAVGLAHLLAEDGLVNTLRAAGYTVELVSYS